MESPFFVSSDVTGSAVSTIPLNAVKRQRATVSTSQSVAAKKSKLSTRGVTSSGAAVALRFETNTSGSTPQTLSKSSSSSTSFSGFYVQESIEKAFARLVASVHEGTTSDASFESHPALPLAARKGTSSTSRSARSATTSSSSPIARILSAANEMQWSAVEFDAGCPSPVPRWGHAATLLKPDGGEMLINGGESIDGTTLADTYILSVPSSGASSSSARPSWSMAPFSPDAPMRKWHSLVHWRAAERGWILALGQLGDPKQDLAQQSGHQSSSSLQSPRSSTSSSTRKDSAPPEEENPCTVDDLSTFDPSCSLWFAPAVTGRVPINRHGHSMTLVPKARMPQASALQRDSEAVVVVFGGVRSTINTKKGTHRMQYLNDLYAWPVSSHKWHHIATTEGRAPKARSFHSAVAVGSKLIVFGGTDGEESFDDVSYLACEPTVSAPDTWAWHQPTITGKGPSPRAAASATVIGDRFVLFIGGHDPTEEVEQMTSTANSAINVSSSKGPSRPLPSISTDAGLSSDAAALIVAELSARNRLRKSGDPFADAWLLDAHLWEWIRLAAPLRTSTSSSTVDQYAVEKLCARAGHTAALIRDARALVQTSSQSSGGDSSQPISAVVLFGGKSAGGISSDVSVLTLPQSLIDAAFSTQADDLDHDSKRGGDAVDVDVDDNVEKEEAADDIQNASGKKTTPTTSSDQSEVKVAVEEQPAEDDGWGEVE